MANTTFSGPVRSENGFEQVTKNATTGAFTVEATYDTRPTFRVAVDNSTFSGAGGATDTLTTAESGTTFIVNGTGNNVINMPALSTDNVGTQYHFFLTTAVGGGTTTTWVLPGAGVSNFFGALELMGGTAANPASDIAGDTLTWVNSTVANARCTITCMTDDGTNSTWKVESLSTPIATIA
jgi:hypothetical protein